MKMNAGRRCLCVLVVVALASLPVASARSEELPPGMVQAEDEFREESGEPSSGSGEKHESIFPLWKDLAEEHLEDLPLPYGAGVVMNWIGSDYALVKADLAINGEPVGSFDLEGSGVQSSAYVTGIKGDVWLFPFANVFLNVGYADIDATVVLRGIPIPTGGIPPTVDADIVLPLDMDGTYYAFGTVIAAAVGNVFLVSDFVWAVQDLNAETVGLDDDKVRAFTSAPRVGYHSKFMEAWVGGRYLSVEQNYSGSFDIGGGNTLEYDVTTDAADWHFIAGMHAMLYDHWEIAVEGGVGDRNSIVYTVGYRW
jgi:hypothetical protein